MLASRLLQRPQFSLGDQAPRTFGFNPRRNALGTGLPVSVVYGRHRVFPRLIQQFIESLNDQEYLYSLYAVSEGPILAIADVEINEQPSANFANVTVETRLGTASQTVIPWFQDARNTFAVGVALNTDAGAHTYTTAGQVDAFVVKLRFPSGLQGGGTGAGAGAGQVVVLIEYRVQGTGTYTSLGSFTINENKPNINFVRQFRADNLTRARYDVRVTRSSSVSASLNPMTYDSIDEILYGANAYANVALLGVRIQATDQLSGEAPRVSALVDGRTVRTLTGSVLSTTEGFSENPVECLIDLLTNARYGLGGRITDADLVLSSFQTAKDYCNDTVTDPVSEARHRLGIVLDERRIAFEWRDILADTFRGGFIESDERWKLAVDHTGSVSQVFSDANIIQGSFKTSWVSLAEEFEQVEVVFLNADLDYDRDSVRFPSGSFSKVKTIQLNGITRASQALREAKYHLNAISALSRLVEFDCALEALAVEVGDLILVSHSLPQWGFSGRVMAVATADAGVNHLITVDPGPTDLPTGGLSGYALAIRKQTDAIETKTTILSVTAPYTTTEGYKRQDVKVSGLFSPAPTARDSVWVFGLVTEVAKTFRVLAITLNEDLTRHVTAMEYNAAIYDATGLVLPARSPSLLPNPDAPPGSVTELALVVRREISRDGTMQTFVDAAWNAPVLGGGSGMYRNARVFMSLYQGQDAGMRERSAVYVGDATTTAYTLGPIPVETLSLAGTARITVYVVAVSTRGIAQLLSQASAATLLIAYASPAAIYDQFEYAIEPGDEIDPALWIVTKAGTAVPDVEHTTAHEVRLHTGTTSGNSVTVLTRAVIQAISPIRTIRGEWRVIVEEDPASGTFEFGLIGAAGYVWANAIPRAVLRVGTTAGTIRFVTIKNQAPTNSETTDNIPVNPMQYHIYRIEIDSVGPVARLYVDGILRATHSTYVDINAGSLWASIVTNSAADRHLRADYASLVSLEEPIQSSPQPGGTSVVVSRPLHVAVV